MNFRSSWSLRKKLLLLVLIAVLPALGIILSAGIEDRNDELISAKRNIQLLTQSLAAQQEQITNGIKQTLQPLPIYRRSRNSMQRPAIKYSGISMRTIRSIPALGQ